MTDLYLYQTVHLHRGRARCVGEHAALLDRESRRLFGRGYAPQRLRERVEALAAAQRFPRELSGFVRIEVTAEGGERLLPAGSSYYDGYALRSVTPDAVSLAYDAPLDEAPTSAREAAALLARCVARRAGADAAVRCDAAGRFLSAEDAPLAAVRGHRVLLAPGMQGVERSLLVRAVRAAGLELSEEPFGRAELARIDELFWVDHRGVTAIAHCDGQPLMTFMAERIAGSLEALFGGE